jgi:hypothetical protein
VKYIKKNMQFKTLFILASLSLSQVFASTQEISGLSTNNEVTYDVSEFPETSAGLYRRSEISLQTVDDEALVHELARRGLRSKLNKVAKKAVNFAKEKKGKIIAAGAAIAAGAIGGPAAAAATKRAVASLVRRGLRDRFKKAAQKAVSFVQNHKEQIKGTLAAGIQGGPKAAARHAVGV